MNAQNSQAGNGAASQPMTQPLEGYMFPSFQGKACCHWQALLPRPARYQGHAAPRGACSAACTQCGAGRMCTKGHAPGDACMQRSMHLIRGGPRQAALCGGLAAQRVMPQGWMHAAQHALNQGQSQGCGLAAQMTTTVVGLGRPARHRHTAHAMPAMQPRCALGGEAFQHKVALQHFVLAGPSAGWAGRCLQLSYHASQ